MRRFRLCTAFALIVLFGLPLCAGRSDARDLTRDEMKWARTCIRGLSANSAKVRAGAEGALILLGSDVLDVVLANLKDVKGRAAEAGLKRVLAGIGPKTVARWVARQRESLAGSPSKRLDQIESMIGSALAPGEAHGIPTAAVETLAWETVPFAAERVILNQLPRKLAGAAFRVASDKGNLIVDTDADGRTDRTVEAGTSARIEVGLGRTKRPLLLYDKLGTWFACSAAVRSGTLGKQQIEIWDADLDGSFAGSGDYIRVGDGAWIRQHGKKRVMLHAGPATYAIDATGETVTIQLTPLSKPTDLDAARWRTLGELNQFRNRVGRPALLADAERSAACTLHAKYLASNAARDPQVAAGGNSHGEDPKNPGYTEQGDTAGRSSNIMPGGLNDVIETIARTMLHRIHWLSSSTERVGLGTARKGKQAWTVVWAGDGDPVEHGSPIPVPAPGQVGVSRFGGGEWPHPDASPDFYKKRRGFPVSVTYAPQRLTDVRLSLWDTDGTTGVPGQLWTIESPITKSHASNGGSAFFMPIRPLARKHRYWAIFRARDGAQAVRYIWTFRTR